MCKFAITVRVYFKFSLHIEFTLTFACNQALFPLPQSSQRNSSEKFKIYAIVNKMAGRIDCEKYLYLFKWLGIPDNSAYSFKSVTNQFHCHKHICRNIKWRFNMPFFSRCKSKSWVIMFMP